jgi:NADPH-dependent glutamate synthase beta subunit-like oxidoreductase
MGIDADQFRCWASIAKGLSFNYGSLTVTVLHRSKTVIIGSGPAGYTAAIYTARRRSQTHSYRRT